MRLAVDAFRAALDDSGLAKSDIDGVLTCRLGPYGFSPNPFCQAVGLMPRVTGMLDYGTGGFTTQHAAFLVASGVCEVVLCVFAMNPGSRVGDPVGTTMWDPIHGYIGAAAYAGLGWTQYMARYGIDEDNGARTLGEIAAQLRRHAQSNPDAAWRDPFTVADYLATDYQIWPLRRADTASRTAGAVAMIVTTAERAHTAPNPPVYFEALGRQEVPRNLETDGYFLTEGMRSVADQVFGAAGLQPSDIDVLGISDAQTVAVCQTLENYGFCGPGESVDFVHEGNLALNGTIPVNTDGGQLSCGYMVGWLHHVEIVRQLRGQAGDRQIAGARIGQYCTTGGSREHYLSTIFTVD
jgi:acetyl-CoA acetyltransferase